MKNLTSQTSRKHFDQQNKLRFIIGQKPTSNSGWQDILNFISLHYKLNDSIYRKDLIFMLKSKQLTLKDNRSMKTWTLDTYVAYLCKAGYMTKVKRGCYCYIKKFPKNFKMNDCRIEAYGDHRK